MQPNVRGIGVQISEDLYKFIKEKIEKLNKYLRKILYIDIIIKFVRKKYFTEINTSVDGLIIHAEAEGNDPYISVERVIDKVVKQAKRYKEKIKSHKISSTSRYPISSIPENSEGEKFSQIFTTKELVKPMSIEEAIMQLNLLKKNFFFFLNINTHCINAIYKNKDGNIVLVEPEV